MPKAKKRRLAAIMFTDIVGYSAMMQKNEVVTTRLRNRHREVFKRLHGEYDGEIIQYFGDGTLSVFDSTADAVECAVEMQRELKQTPQVPIRVGIHTGDIVFRDVDIIGDGVNIAARIQAQCVPGGVFISEKAYDDIKNHPELGTRPVGESALKNIERPMNLYAITNPGITAPDYAWKPQRFVAQPKARNISTKPRKKRWVAALLAFFFGVFGVHRFYLEQRKLGILYLTMFMLGAFILPGLEQLVAIPAILGFVDFLIFAFGSRASFDERYNSGLIHAEQQQQQQQQQQPKQVVVNEPKRILRKQRKKYLKQALAAHKEFEYEEAIEAASKAIEIKYDDPKLHYFLARCFSLTEQADKALEHLDLAVAFGFQDFDRIKTEEDLAFVRIQPAYIAFEGNNFQLPEPEPTTPQEDVLKLDKPAANDLLDQLSRLEKARNAGLLSEEEYLHKEKQLRTRGRDGE